MSDPRFQSGADARLQELAAAVVEGELDAAGARQLRALLHESAGAQQFFADYLDLHVRLQGEHGGVQYGPATDRGPGRAPRGRRWLVRYAAAAAIVLAVATLFSVLVRKESTSVRMFAEAPVATLVDARNVVWSPGAGAASPGAQLGPGFLRLDSGMVELEFFSGARVRLIGPAEFGLNSRSRGFVRTGQIAVYCPPQARGFTVGAPGVSVIDLGTEFRMRVLEEGLSEVQVLKGRVALQKEGSGELREFHVGEAARYNPRQATIEPIPAVLPATQILLAGRPCLVIPAAAVAGKGWQVVQDREALDGRALRAAQIPGEVVYPLRFSRAGTYYLYYRARAEAQNVTSHDSFLAPPAFNAAPSVSVNGYGGVEARRYGGGKGFSLDYQWFVQGGKRVEPIAYHVSEQDLASPRPLEFRIGTRETGTIVDRFILSADPNLFSHVGTAELDAAGDPFTLPPEKD